ncbi:MAG: zinc metallopeptidase [Bacteroidales bacterium]|jgi:Zn-dependent membrane protease YugP|nr:zinc metallopeptidase [Bacteroidales bacterium]MDI9593319.1 zinc metallopeptidase [Bacteroidota bacterium]NLH33095.1 zinc metallopeptidase [Lentimicrobium sp.]MBP7873557.1 zinc metallopeptidase [Bacteroidales bacterium]MCO6468353.1 zinc metallopeptidase [Bacteroidales bacterium]
MIPYILIFGVFVFLSWIVQSRLKNRFEKYSKVALPGGQTGADIARIMLSQNGITDVKVQSVGGELTDHYNPLNKTINLSPAVYNGRSVMSAAVAAHETGHALQHAQAYAWLQMRSQLVPVVSISSKWMQWVLLAGILTIQIFPALLLIGIIMFGLTTLFSLITLPVEFDASRRALVWLQGTGITIGEQQEMAKDGLKWAAMTYVVAALASLATLAYYIMIFLGRRD